MRFGFRVPSLKKKLAARTSLKRFIRHSVGLKAPCGLGILTNPKKALYNKVYNKTSVNLFKKPSTPKPPTEIVSNNKPEPKKIPFGAILSWFFGVLTLFLGYLELSKHLGTAVFFILAGLIVLPPSNKWIENRFNVSILGIWKVVAFIIFYSIGMSFVKY